MVDAHSVGFVQCAVDTAATHNTMALPPGTVSPPVAVTVVTAPMRVAATAKVQFDTDTATAFVSLVSVGGCRNCREYAKTQHG